MSVSHLLHIGNHALLANQTALSVTGNNIANVNTIGYSKQTALFKPYSPYDSKPGQMGMGVHVSEITRSFDRLMENTFLSRYTSQSRYTEQANILSGVQNVFNEANRKGISSGLNEFFNNWQKVSNLPDDIPTKQALLSNSESLTSTIKGTQQTLKNYEEEINDYIRADVNRANDIIKAIAQLNIDIGKSTAPGNNPNSLMDERDSLVRELSKIVDVKVQDNGGVDFSVSLKTGQPLVNGSATYSLSFEGPKTEYKCEGYTGELIFEGTDYAEYTLEFVDEKTFKVSLDGGHTWLKEADGKLKTYDVPPIGQKVKVKDLEISFTKDDFAEGDSIHVVPKTALYWDSPTRPPVNITPMTYNDGSDDASRLTGGRLAAYFNTRDYNIGRYEDKLDAFSKSFIWEVNRSHSQGASKTPVSSFFGTQKINDTNIALGDSGSGNPFFDKLQSGNFTMFVYDKETGKMVESQPLDFDTTIDGVTNFDPKIHSINDVVSAINNTFGGKVNAQLIDGRIQIEAEDGYNIAFGEDTSGVLASLGINTYFTGSDASTIGVREDLRNNVGLINSGKVNQAGVITAGDNSVALAIAKLATQAVEINSTWETSKQSLTSYYSSIVSLIGAETKNAQFNQQYNTALATDLDNRIAAVSGVSLDEEMTGIIKFQHSYTAAAKLITTADQMLQTVLGLKQ